MQDVECRLGIKCRLGMKSGNLSNVNNTNINNTTSYTLNVSLGISLHFILSPYICDTNNVQRKGNCVTLGLGSILMM